ncbi:ectoine/hydroxyectoine ABC transporter permease subunit EhuD [Bradyrhizobium sp. CNPSo 4010]|uniref:Ectoine/hydroxyectoine ABC transporter permease subunit EhuD n=1 Tax=Bradyrhizobium agreste TaxID=2751811 RepID=A0ABS0PGF4_9BRAD|nr:ectoine/hydroxyectoine ABC transporter permease subunit EhuD [Bradyrhizobium agreste]MBH5396284.1 ectoine/hydroxyectoine ABC transporter permease subunit EhuD [Bradyrhizobium agreste]
MLWEWSYALEVLPPLLRAAAITVEATLLSFAIAASLGLALAVLRMLGPMFAWPLSIFIEFVRSTPLLIQMFFLYFVLPQFGVTLDGLTVGVLTIGVHYATFCAEVYRTGLENIPRGQWEAAVALNLGVFTTFKDVILPQAIPPVVPALGNYLIGIFKATPLLSVVAVLELMGTAKILGSESYRYVEPITLVGLFFLIMSLVSATAIRAVERMLNRRTVG